jgi:hypothetical protein
MELVGTNMFYILTKLLMPDSNSSIVLAAKPKAKKRYHAAAILPFEEKT